MKTNLVSAVASHTIRSAPTLKAALETFVRTTAHEHSGSNYFIVNKSSAIRVCRRRQIAASSESAIYTDLDFFIDISVIVRLFAGNRWQPNQIAFQLWPSAGDFLKNYFPNTQFVSDKGSSWIEVPLSILMLPRHADSLSEDLVQEKPSQAGSAVMEGADFVYALKQVLKAQLCDGYPEIDRAAKCMRTSVRTLQRNLARAGLTYSKLVEFARFEIATEMLGRPNLKMIDIAYALGYQDPSHFSRAFRRFIGQTPREYRAIRIGETDA